MPPRQPRKMVGRSAESRGPSEARNRSALQLIAQRFADLAQIRRADLLAGLDDEFGIEAELAAARLANRTQRRQIDAVLALVVGGAAAIDALAFGGRLPRIEIVAPFAGHAVDDVAMAVGEHGRAARHPRDSPPADKGPCRSAIRSIGSRNRAAKMPAAVLYEIGAQAQSPAGVLAFGLIGDPAVEFVEKFAGMKMLARLRNRVGSRRHDFFLSHGRKSSVPPTYRDIRPAGSGTTQAEWALLNQPECNNFGQQPGIRPGE